MFMNWLAVSTNVRGSGGVSVDNKTIDVATSIELSSVVCAEHLEN